MVREKRLSVHSVPAWTAAGVGQGRRKRFHNSPAVVFCWERLRFGNDPGKTMLRDSDRVNLPLSILPPIPYTRSREGPGPIPVCTAPDFRTGQNLSLRTAKNVQRQMFLNPHNYRRSLSAGISPPNKQNYRKDPLSFDFVFARVTLSYLYC